MPLKNIVKNTIGIKDHRIVYLNDRTENIAITSDDTEVRKYYS